MKLTNELTIQALENTVGIYKDANNQHYINLEVYNSELPTSSIEDILKSDCPYDALVEEVYEHWFDASLATQDEYFSDWVKELHKLNINTEDEDLWEIFSNAIYVNFPLEHCQNQEVRVNLMLDTGDGKSDFTENCLQEDGSLSETAGIVWLAKTQGYTYQQVQEVLNGSVSNPEGFLETLLEEVENATYEMNTVTFLLTISLQELIDWKENKKSITIGKTVECGLFNPWNGSGSLLEIKLEKPVVIPYEMVYDIQLEGTGNYTVDAVYGLIESMWRDEVTFN